MENLNNKRGNHTSHFTHRTSQNGITLIALIITIIVMLILVGVTINVALNGGLFTKAEQATKETEEKAILEEMLAMMDITDEGKINYSAIIQKMENKYGKDNVSYSYPNATITGKLGTYNYIVSETEIKIGPKGNENGSGENISTDLELIKTYFLGAIDETTGERPKGINIVSLVENPEILEDLSDPTQLKFKDNDKLSLISAGGDGEKNFGCVKYNDTLYKVILDKDYVIQDVYVEIEKFGVLGKYVQYDGKLWRVLYSEGEYGEGAQLISKEVLEIGNVYLGNDDSQIVWTNEDVISEADVIEIDGSLTDMEKAIYSYNNAIDTLNNKCKSLVTFEDDILKDVRCLGTNPANWNDSAGMLKKSQVPNYTGTWFDIYDGKIKQEDENYLIDSERIMFLGLGEYTNSYWIASRHHTNVSWNPNEWGYFGIRVIGRPGDFDDQLFRIKENNISGVSLDNDNGVIPVIVLQKGALDNLEGEGTLESPFVL